MTVTPSSASRPGNWRRGRCPSGRRIASRSLRSRAPSVPPPQPEAVPDDRQAPDSSEPPVEEGELREVEIEDTGEKGDGIARVGPGYVVFVSDTKVGDRVTVRITQARDNFAFAEVVEAEPVSD